MKKTIVMLAVVAVVAGAYADILANMQVGFGIAGDGDNGGIVNNVAGSAILVQLIDGGGDGLSYVAPGKISGLTMDGNDLLLASWGSAATGGGDFADWAALASANIQTTWAADTYIRVIGAGLDGINSGDWVWETGLISFVDKDMTAVPGPSPETVFYDNGGAGGTADGSIQVIPEPATLGLMGVAGLGMFLARKKARR